MPRISLAAVVLGTLRAESGIFEDEGAAIAERNFFGLPGGGLVERVGLRLDGIPGTIEPIEIRLLIGDPFFDGLPGWLDGFHGFDVEGWWGRARKMDDACPKTVEAEEEFDFLAPDDSADPFHGALAVGTFERIATPHLEYEVAPERAHVAGPAFGWGGDEEDLGGGL